MKIAVDISPLQSAHKGRGIGQYTKNLVDALEKSQKEGVEFIFTHNPEKCAVDLIHYPYFDLFKPTLPVFSKTPVVVTIHDVIPLVFAEHYPIGIKGTIYHWRQRLALSRVKAIATDSQCSNKDIQDFLKQNQQKVTTIYLAADDGYSPATKNQLEEVRSKYELPTKYLLYVGDINYNKNLPALIRALGEGDNNEINLVIVSRALGQKNIPESVEIYKLITSRGLEKQIRILVDVSSEVIDDLRSIYSGAWAYIQPSLYEGFGLPVLEAMQCGVPVICADASSLPEVGGEAVWYFDPNRIEDMTRTLSRAWEMSDKKRLEMITKGLEQVKKFSWEETAKQTINWYLSCVN